MIVIVILAVVGGVLLVHVILELIMNRYRLWKRYRNQHQSSSNNVRYKNGSRSRSLKIENGSDEDTDAQETSRLIFFDNRHTERHEDSSNLSTTSAGGDFSTRENSRQRSQSGSHSTTDEGCGGSIDNASSTSELYGTLHDQDAGVEVISDRCSSKNSIEGASDCTQVDFISSANDKSTSQKVINELENSSSGVAAGTVETRCERTGVGSLDSQNHTALDFLSINDTDYL